MVDFNIIKILWDKHVKPREKMSSETEYMSSGTEYM